MAVGNGKARLFAVFLALPGDAQNRELYLKAFFFESYRTLLSREQMQGNAIAYRFSCTGFWLVFQHSMPNALWRIGL